MWPYIHLKECRSLTWIERKKARDKAVWGESKWVFFAAQWLCAVALWRQRKLNESQGGILWCWSDSRNQLNLISSSFVTEKNQNLVSVILMIRLEVTCFTLPKLRWWWGARACKRSEQNHFFDICICWVQCVNSVWDDGVFCASRAPHSNGSVQPKTHSFRTVSECVFKDMRDLARGG